MQAAPSTAGLKRGDWAILCAFALLLLSLPALVGPILTTHETVHCVNTREMIETGDLIIPTYAGRPWLERPPLPFWITAALVQLTGGPAADWAYRLSSILMGLGCVLLTAWIAARWFGRGIGLLSGLILATMREFQHYGSTSEADIFVAALVTLGIALFVRLSVPRAPEDNPRQLGIFGTRPWAMAAFFVVLGLTNLTKGLFFGMLFILVPAGSFLLLQGWAELRRYLWFWGVLLGAAAALPWPILAYLRCPEIMDLWHSDYFGRVAAGYMREPWWYYAVHLPWNLFPWTLPALVGLGAARPFATPSTAGSDTADGATVRRFLWCWALTPILFFSLSKGKHHHYLLNVMAPWAVLGALGARRIWEFWRQHSAALWRHPITLTVVLGLPVSAFILLRGERVPGPTWLPTVAALAWPSLVLVIAWSFTRPTPRAAFVPLFAVVALAFVGKELFWKHCIVEPRARADFRFMQEVERLTPPGATLMVLNGDGPLDASWWLHYLQGRPRLLQNATWILDKTIDPREVYLILRPRDEVHLAAWGTFTPLCQSERSRAERTPADRWTLYRYQFRPDVRGVDPQPISTMQATGRAAGPFLGVR